MRAHDGRASADGGWGDGRPPRTTTRRRRVLTQLGRAATVVVPVALLLALDGSLFSARGVAWGLVLAGVFLVSLHASLGATDKELFMLGAPVAAARGTAIGFVAVSAIDLWVGVSSVSVLGLLLCSVAIFVLATAFGTWLRGRTRRILIVGAGNGTRDLIEELQWAAERFEAVGIVDDDAESDVFAGVAVLGGLDDLPRVIENERPDLVVVGLERNRPAMFRHLLDHAALGFRVVELAQFYEHAFGRVPVRDLKRAWFMSVLHLYQRPYSRAANRAFDLTVALLAIVLVLPLIIVLPVLIRTSRGPAILRQIRLGENGEHFTMYKFRTMRADAEAGGVAVWANEDDQRVTAVGRFIRRFRLDEIPQFWNVVRGDMSIVGPRPERPEFLVQLQEQVPFWDRRHLIKPGITGWAQIRRGYTADADGSLEKLSFDLWYLRHRSLVVDVAICVQTIAVLVRGGPPRRVRRGNEFAQRLRTSSPYAALSSRLVALVATSQGHGNGSNGKVHALEGAENGAGPHASTNGGAPARRRRGLQSDELPLHPVAVLGAGPAGLTAAHALMRRQMPAVVFEADAQVGGIAKTVEVDGYRFDLGGHRFFTKLLPVQQLWEDMLGDDFLVRSRLSRIYYDGQYFAYPLRAADVPKRLGLVEFARCLGSYAVATVKGKKSADTFEEWVTNRFGSRIYETFFRSYTEKVWGIPGSEIRSEWAAQRIKDLSLWKALLNALGVSRGQVTSLIEEFRYPALGPGQMWDAFSDTVERGGIPVHLEHRCTRLEHDGAKVDTVVVESNGTSVEQAVSGVLSSIPLKELVLSLDPAPPPEVVDAAHRLRYRDLCLVALMTTEEQPFADNWIYLHDPGTRAGRVQNFGAWSPALVRPGTTCLGVEYFCFEGDDIWEMSEEDAVDYATGELARIGLIDATKVFSGARVHVPKAYPMYDGDYAESVAVIREYLERFENLQTFGRNGLHRYNNQDHSMWTAMLAALNLLDGSDWDVWSVNAEAKYHEEGETIDALLAEPLSQALAQPSLGTTQKPQGKLRLDPEPVEG